MKLHYYTVDDKGRIRRVSQKVMEDLWDGRVGADTLGCTSKTELRLVSVLCDNKLWPRTIYLLRVSFFDGTSTPENQLTLQIFTMRHFGTAEEVAQHHGGGWPVDLLRQLAVALDVPLSGLSVPVRIGGPLFLAAATGLTPSQARQLLR